MDDISVKAKNFNPAAPALKDAGGTAASSPAEALALAFNQFLRKAAPKSDQLRPGTRGQVLPFQLALNFDRPDFGLNRAGFERRDDFAPHADTAPAPTWFRDNRDLFGRDSYEPTGASAQKPGETDAPPAAAAATESGGKRADASSQANPKDDAENRSTQAKGQARESVDGDDRGRGRRKKFAGAPKEQAEAVLAGLAAGVRPGNAEKRADDDTHTPTEQADDAADETRRMTGIANALSQLAKQPRGSARNSSHRDAEDNQAAAPHEHTVAASEDGKTSAKKPGRSGEVRARQAADLAGRIGPDVRMLVEVTVNDDAKTLVSRPTAALISTHDEKGANAGLTRFGNSELDGMGEQAFFAANQSEAAEAVAGRLGAGMGGLNVAAQDSAEMDGPMIQLNTQGIASGGGSSTRVLEAPGQTNAAQNAQRPVASFRAEVLEQVSVTIQKAIKEGTDRITVQLRPAELGRIDVRIEVAGDGRTLVHVTADRADTLDLLQRDARDLARSLQDAGLRADAGNLQFSLREQTAEHRERPTRGGAASDAGAVDGVATETELVPDWTPTVRPGRVDIRA
jgi:flagellar hook-length control protein FliK